MASEQRQAVRNLAVIAHVDHGKTTLIDALLWQAELLADGTRTPRQVLQSMDLDREKAVTVMPKHLSLLYRGTRIHLVDTPGQADLGAEIDRVLALVEGVLLVVDAAEGPVPQTRYALRKALEAGLSPLVVINKIDVPGANPAETLEHVREAFRDLEAGPRQLEFPVWYCNARNGLCRRQPDGEDEPMTPLLDGILETVPAPTHDPQGPLQVRVTHQDYDDFLGRLATGRVHGGRIETGAEIAHCRLDGSVTRGRVAGLYRREGLRLIERNAAGPGEIVEVAGIESVRIGETLADAERPEALPPIEVEEPVISVLIRANDSPMAGLEGPYAAGAKLRERLWTEILTNSAVRVEETDAPDAFRVWGRGELQLAILVEMMRREGFEMVIGPPTVATSEENGESREPVERMVVDCPERYTAVVSQKIETRRGKLVRMVNHGTGRVRLDFRIPSRGMIGLRSELLNDTGGTGMLNHQFDGWAAWHGEISRRTSGSLISDREGRCTAYAIAHTQHRGSLFVAPGDRVYEGMIVGENSHANDLDVNVTKSAPDPERGARAASTSPLLPPRSLSIEQALDFIRDDEVVEATPGALRLRKRDLSRGGAAG
jgi:GTP-binding protein